MEVFLLLPFHPEPFFGIFKAWLPMSMLLFPGSVPLLGGWSSYRFFNLILHFEMLAYLTILRFGVNALLL